MLGRGSIGPAWGRLPGGHLGFAAVAVVAATTLAGCTGGTPKPGPSPTAKALKITSFTATAVSPGEVDLTWTAEGPDLYGYQLYRNGKFVQILKDTSYKDTGVQPKRTYEYKVDVQDSKGNYSPDASATVSTPGPPPLSTARFAGQFDARLTFLSENYTNLHVGQKYGERWKIVPHCATGACSVSMQAGRPGEHPTTLKQRGTTYKGTGSDKVGKCGSTRVRESFTVTITVTRGTYVDGVWRVAAFKGTQTQYGPPALGCAS